MAPLAVVVISRVDPVDSDAVRTAFAVAAAVSGVVRPGCFESVATAGVGVESVCGSESVAAGSTTGPEAVAEPGTVALFTAFVVGAVGVPGST